VTAIIRGPRVQVRLIERFEALEAFKDSWNALAARAQTATIFQTYELHASWWTACAANASACVLLAEADGELVGIAPLVRSDASMLGLRRRVVQFIGARSFDYTDFIVAPGGADVLEALVEAALAQTGYDVLYLRDIPDRSPTLAVLRAVAARRGAAADVRTLYPAPTRLFNDPIADRALANKKSLKRHHKALAKRGRVEFRNLVRAADIEGYLDAFFDQHVGRRGITDSPSVFVDPRQREFFRDVVRRAAPRSWLLFSVVLLDGRPVAMHFGFEYGNTLTWYKPSFDIDYAHESPGEVLIKYLIEYALERGVSELDFTIGEEAFKYRFANHVRHNCAARVYRRGRERYVDRCMLAVRSAIERHPVLERAVRKAFWRLRDRSWM
jgi:CelD/BcsL family acetyltransferase involved in cellulose biosynthesis